MCHLLDYYFVMMIPSTTGDEIMELILAILLLPFLIDLSKDYKSRPYYRKRRRRRW